MRWLWHLTWVSVVFPLFSWPLSLCSSLLPNSESDVYHGRKLGTDDELEENYDFNGGGWRTHCAQSRTDDIIKGSEAPLILGLMQQLGTPSRLMGSWQRQKDLQYGWGKAFALVAGVMYSTVQWWSEINYRWNTISGQRSTVVDKKMCHHYLKCKTVHSRYNNDVKLYRHNNLATGRLEIIILYQHINCGNDREYVRSHKYAREKHFQSISLSVTISFLW